MVGQIEINGKKYSKRTVEILSGVKNFFDINENLLLIAEVMEHPYDFPFLLEDIYDMDFDEDLRLALVRVQIDAKMHMRDDLESGQVKLFVAETIEKMLFGELLLEGDGKGVEKAEKKADKKDKKKGKSKGKAKSKAKGSGKGGSKGKDKNKGKGKGKGKGKAKSDGKGGGKGKGKGKGKDKGKGKSKKSNDSSDKDWEEIYA